MDDGASDPHLRRQGHQETDHGAGEGVEDAGCLRRLFVRQDQVAALSGCHGVVVAEQRQLSAEEAAGVGVQQEHLFPFALEDLVEDDPSARLESAVGGVVLGVVGGGAPAWADGAEVHVAIEVVGGEEGVGDAVDEVGREGGPGCGRRGRKGRRGFETGRILLLPFGRRRSRNWGGQGRRGRLCCALELLISQDAMEWML